MVRKPIRIKISPTRSIGDDEPCFIIVDAGSNHNCDFSMAKRLIDRAREAGADAIKFQTYSADTLYSRYTPLHSKYRKPPWELIREIELPRHWQADLKAYADKKGIIFFSTPFDFSAADELNGLGCALFKIASAEIVDLELIGYIARTKKPLIISTGMANAEEIKDACRVCEKNGNRKLIILQCTTNYPAKFSSLNLKAIESLRNQFRYVTGLSDHSLGIHIPLAAVALGAKVIEKHFTLNRRLKGPDHHFAIEPDELKVMVKQIRDVERSLGNGKKLGPSVEEMENFKIARRSVHAKVGIPKGGTITKDKLAVKRPGYGIKPKFIGTIIGKTAKRDIAMDEWITQRMVR
jgi:N,N'-diacetyllegionaminate synthase